jgi:hypothetical protein
MVLQLRWPHFCYASTSTPQLLNGASESHAFYRLRHDSETHCGRNEGQSNREQLDKQLSPPQGITDWSLIQMATNCPCSVPPFLLLLPPSGSPRSSHSLLSLCAHSPEGSFLWRLCCFCGFSGQRRCSVSTEPVISGLGCISGFDSFTFSLALGLFP